MTSPLPKFARPPVVETAVAVQFKELKDFNQAHFGWFQQTIVDRYDKAEDQPRLLPADEPEVLQVPSGFQFHEAKIPDRMSFTERDDGPVVIQLQPDRFGLNWKKSDRHTDYPSWEVVGARFSQEFEHFAQFCKASGLRPLLPSLCDLTYVNHIVPREDETVEALFSDLFLANCSIPVDTFLPSMEGAAFNRVYRFESGGRLYAEASIGVHRELGKIISFKLTGRAKLSNDSIDDVLNKLHERIVRGFASLTNEAIRRDRWEQLQ